jgi:hypothetical protein
MSSPTTDGPGRPEVVTEQDVLKVFDFDISEDNPMLTAGEVADGLAEHFDVEASTEAVRQKLQQMEADDKVVGKKFGASAVGWRALVGPRLAPEVAARLDERAETPVDEYVPLVPDE